MAKKTRARKERIADMDREILDVQGAATLLGVSKTTIYKLAQQGSLPAARVGKEWRFARKNLIDWISLGGTNSSKDQLTALLKSSTVRARK